MGCFSAKGATTAAESAQDLLKEFAGVKFADVLTGSI